MTELERMEFIISSTIRDCEQKDCMRNCEFARQKDCKYARAARDLQTAGYGDVNALKAENAALRKQISEMLMPLCTLGDKLYHYELSFGDGFDMNGKVIHTSSMDIIETEVTKDNIWGMNDLVQNKRAFISREALAASFKERFQKGREQFVKEIKDDKRRTD